MKTAIVICTYRRDKDVEELLGVLANITRGRDVVVVDSSPDELTREQCETAASPVTYILSPVASLAYQRNVALDHLTTRGYECVHFLDDDSRPEPGYFDAIERTLGTGDFAGVGGVIPNQRPTAWRIMKSIFLLDSSNPGRVLPSGRTTIGHYPGSSGAVEWLPGCAMSYSLKKIEDLRFDERLSGYSWGEDFDFSYRLSRRERLVIEPRAILYHNESAKNRLTVLGYARGRVPLMFRWVSENRHLGMSRKAFWWATFGEVMLRTLGGVASKGAKERVENRAFALGTLQGIRDLSRERGR